ncbi:RAMP superfamily CRISPR-associated protein [Acidianus manzaensis]|uniref:CRISPR type III-associated protein domain-containing protein n=1 Tax=Acidianus manzaensis TaxID=282676 RepID=A0A1W6JWF4_9CREN|nr:RAMP superfamily CRISPR-associated protein [Acidianus manzaensis]ARM74593.1 hypothetical protein B6F84_00145 [Acidianus manzaensis]
MSQTQRNDFFYSYYLLTEINLSITNKSPLRVGAGKGNTIGEPDLPILRTPDRRAVIPGSTMKGVVRNNIARMLKIETENLSCVFGGEVKEENKGNKQSIHVGSSVIFSDFVTDKVIESTERAHIQINLQTGGVRNLFSVEYVPENNTFKGKIVGRNIPLPTLSGIVYITSFLLNSGIVRVGGFKSRGYGLVNLSIDSVEVSLPSKSFNYKTKITLSEKEEEVSVNAGEKELSVKEDKEYKFKVEGMNEDFLYKVKLNPGEFLNVGKAVSEGWMRR